MNLAAATGTEIERALRAHSLPGLEDLAGREDFVFPHYSAYSVANVPATVAGLLGAELPAAAPPLPGELWSDLIPAARRVVLVVLDAVGYRTLCSMLDQGDPVLRRLVDAGRFLPLTTVFPSTTISALTTLWTGVTPLEHGLLGTRLLLSPEGVLASMLHLSPLVHSERDELLDWGLKPEEFVPVPGVGTQLSRQGIATTSHTYGYFLGSGLSRIFLRGVDQVTGFVAFSDAWINLRQDLARPGDERSFLSVYWGGFDAVGHRYGPEGEHARVELRYLFRTLWEDCLAPLPASARQGTVMLLVADHGQLPTPRKRAVWLPTHPALMETLLFQPAGEARAAYLYPRSGQADVLRDYVTEHLADRFVLLETERALAAGLFGPGEASPRFRSRLGDFLLLARDDARLVVEEGALDMAGHHGSLTPREMLVPLLIVPLGEV
jgi:hypothetical protein